MVVDRGGGQLDTKGLEEHYTLWAETALVTRVLCRQIKLKM